MSADSDTIFIQIASYRDPQLFPTLEDCIKNAKKPQNLRFCIAWQHGTEEQFPEKYQHDARFKIIDIPYQESKGACWARNQIQQFYKKEKYTLQLDSHHRFIQDWDQELINMLENLKKDGYKKPILTGYMPSFNPENDPAERVKVPWKMDFDRFTPEGVVFFLPASIEEKAYLEKPMPARFYSAHFCFADGIFAEEVQHDPNYYFHGEEISIAVRAFTHGYDLFHPHKLICWHEYTRKGRSKHWDDDKEWFKKNTDCHLRNKKLFEMDGEKRDIDFGKYGFGDVRELKEYEDFAGIQFSTRGVQKYTSDRKVPPNPRASSEEEQNKLFLKRFRHCIDVQHNQVPEKDYDFWAVIFLDKNGIEVNRKDADENEIRNIKSDKDYCKIWRDFICENGDSRPRSWIVWPHSKSKGWCEQISGSLG